MIFFAVKNSIHKQYTIYVEQKYFQDFQESTFECFLKGVFCVDCELSGIIWSRGFLAPQKT